MHDLRLLGRREPGMVAAYVVLLLVVGVCASQTSNLDLAAFTITLAQKLPLVMAAIGVTIVIVSKGIDLSVGAVLAIVNVIIASGAGGGGSVLLWTAVGLLVAMMVGLANGLLVAYGRLPSLVVTLATSSILTGAALYVLPQPGGSVPTWFTDLPLTLIGPIPLAVLLIILIPGLTWYPLRRSPYGPALYAVGGDAAAAYVSGVRVRPVTVGAYVLSSLFAGVGGVFVTMNAASGDASIGAPFTLNAIASAALGGALLAGGRGTILGSIAGALTLQFLTNLLFSLGLNGSWQYVAVGVVLVLALVAPLLTGRLAARRSGATT